MAVVSNALEFAGAALVVAALWLLHPAAGLFAGGLVVFAVGVKIGRA